MARKTAGARYPHASSTARQHDHRWCPVIGVIAERVADGAEDWGLEHVMPPIGSETRAVEIRQGLFRGRDCAKLKKAHGELSVSVTYRAPDGTLSQSPVVTYQGYVLVVRVWPRVAGKKEVARRVTDGEALHYNVMRSS